MLYDAMKLKGLTHESRLSGDMDFIKEIQLNTEHIQWFFSNSILKVNISKLLL